MSSLSRALLYGAAAAAIMAPAPAFAHAVLVSSTPAQHAMLKSHDLATHLSFNSRIDAAHSRLYVAGPGGKVQMLALEPQSNPESLDAKSITLPSGSYTIRWQALAADGHITRGEIPFTVQ